MKIIPFRRRANKGISICARTKVYRLSKFYKISKPMLPICHLRIAHEDLSGALLALQLLWV